MLRVVTLSSIILVCFSFVLVGWIRDDFKTSYVDHHLLLSLRFFSGSLSDLAIESRRRIAKRRVERLTSQKINSAICQYRTSFGCMVCSPRKRSMGCSAWVADSRACALCCREVPVDSRTGLTAGFMVVLWYLPATFGVTRIHRRHFLQRSW